MGKTPDQIAIRITRDFVDTYKVLDVLSRKKYLDRSRIIREAIRKEVQELLKQYPDVAEMMKEINSKTRCVIFYSRKILNPLFNSN